MYNIDMYKTPQDMDSIVHNLRSLKDVSLASSLGTFFIASPKSVWLGDEVEKGSTQNVDTYFVEFLMLLHVYS